MGRLPRRSWTGRGVARAGRKRRIGRREGVGTMVGASILLVGLLDYRGDRRLFRTGGEAGRRALRRAGIRLPRPGGARRRGAAGPPRRPDRADPEVRNRAAGLVQKIEGALLTQPTRVRLDFERTPLPEVVRSLSRQAGFKVVLYPDALPRWKYSRVTLHEPEPVTFWKAMDRLCDAALLQPNSQLHGIAGPREPTFALADGAAGADPELRPRPVPGQPAGPPLPARHHLRDPDARGSGASACPTASPAPPGRRGRRSGTRSRPRAGPTPSPPSCSRPASSSRPNPGSASARPAPSSSPRPWTTGPTR